MSGPSAAPASGEPPFSPPPTGGAPPPDESVRVVLSVSRTLALVFAIIAGLLFLVFLAFAIFDLILGRGAGNVVLAVYCLASAAVNFVLWRQVPPLEKLAAARQYAALRDQLIVWAILGILFFVVVGVLLLVVWVKLELLANPRSS